jgi:hypothetical protein
LKSKRLDALLQRAHFGLGLHEDIAMKELLATMSFPRQCAVFSQRAWMIAGAAISTTWAAALTIASGLLAIWVINHWGGFLFGWPQ